ncbi:MAG: STAS domain-containing protein [Actinobacteria bacterium]|nr:STAS domain-containing protein [Actinomycetota bacterium]
MSDPRISIEPRGSAGIVTVAGEVDLSVAPAVAGAIADGAGAATVIVDLTGVTFIDSTGLRALVTGREGLESGGRSMVLAVADGPVARLLALTALEADFTIFPSVESALATG